MKPVKLLEHWLPPDGAGEPVACLATTYTFDVDFFASECLARFLRLSGVHGEGDSVSDVALMLEEEERLSEARVVVLADRNCRPERRNLRWDLLPASVPRALLHAKVVLLIWRRAMRIIIGSANLTPAGYRRQLEAAVAFDVGDGVGPPAFFVDSLLVELRDIVQEHTYGDPEQAGPKGRALDILEIAGLRVSESHLPSTSNGQVRIALAAGRSGVSPLAARAQVWRGGPPRRLVGLSPFWDGDESGMPAIKALLGELARRSPANDRATATFVVAVEPLPGGQVIRAPKTLTSSVSSRVATSVLSLGGHAGEPRRLHAKALLYEGEGCVAVMIGSSNLTGKGLGLDRHSHREINVWFGTLPDTPQAEWLRSLLPCGDPIASDWIWDVGTDEDELALEALPEGFLEALLVQEGETVLQLVLDPAKLPAVWSIRTPVGDLVFDNSRWDQGGRPRLFRWPLGDTALPSALDVNWSTAAGKAQATWPVNVADLKNLPPAAELKDLPVDLLLRVLASTRPLHAALELELRRIEVGGSGPLDPLDPLQRFDCGGLLLHRIRRASAALWGLQRRLERPLVSVDALEWRLRGPIGPLRLGQAFVTEAASGGLRPAEAVFLIAELALTITAVDWRLVGSALTEAQVHARVYAAVADLASLRDSLNLSSCATVDGLGVYVTEAFERAGAP
ncbi:MAG: hypothetical protein ACYC5Q_10115 [Thermoleophilia bacterium]